MIIQVTPVNYGVFSSVDWNVLHRVFVKLEPEGILMMGMI